MSGPVPTCPRCAELLERIAQLERTVRDREARLGENVSNSSLPPSANPPDAPKPVVKKRTGRKVGGQPGHRGLSRLRSCCGHVTRERIPAEIRAHVFGPRLAAALGYLSGSQHLTQRGLEGTTETLFEVPVSLGSVNALQEELSRALGPAHQEIAQVV
jgi:hypothetical protein